MGRFWFHGLTRTFVKTNKEASTELCSLLKHAGKSREAVVSEGSFYIYIYIYIILGRQSPYGHRANISNIITIIKNKKNTLYTYEL